jgi:hypothetical protein
VIRHLSIALLVGLGIIPTRNSAQLTDIGLWASFTVRKDLPKKYTATFSAEGRFINVLYPMSTGFVELGLGRRLTKVISLSADYRFIRRITEEQVPSIRHRIQADATLRWKLESWRLTYRLRGQLQFKDAGTSVGGGTPEIYLRQKLGVKSTHLKKVSLLAAVESFHPVGSYNSTALDELRFALGSGYKLRKNHEVVLFVMLKKELNVPDPHTAYIVGVGYEVDL